MKAETVVLRGASNFRDLGGLSTDHGRTVRAQRLFRSDALDRVGADDLARIEGLQIRLVCDLRSAEEKADQGTRWRPQPPARYLDVDVNAALRSANEQVRRRLADDPCEANAIALMRSTYRAMPVALASCLATLFDSLLEEDGLPALIHCTAGKDRTGFVTAMTLLALGVTREDVYADYLLTNRRLDRAGRAAAVVAHMTQRLGTVPDDSVIAPLLEVRPEYLDAALETVAQQCGSIAGYLAQACRLDNCKQDRLRARLLD